MKEDKDVIDLLQDDFNHIDNCLEANSEIKKIYRTLNYDPEFLNVEYKMSFIPLPTKRRLYWQRLAERIGKHYGIDLEFELGQRIYEYSAGINKKGNISGLKYMLDKIVDSNDKYVPDEAYEIEINTTESWDNPQAINEMAERILKSVMTQKMSIDIAERLLLLLEKKIKFTETSDVQQKLDDIHRAISSSNFAPARIEVHDKKDHED